MPAEWSHVLLPLPDAPAIPPVWHRMAPEYIPYISHSHVPMLHHVTAWHEACRSWSQYHSSPLRPVRLLFLTGRTFLPVHSAQHLVQRKTLPEEPDLPSCLNPRKTDLHSHKSPALLMLSENAPAPATFYDSDRIRLPLSADTDPHPEYNLQFLYTVLPRMGDRTMQENLSHRWLLLYPAVSLFRIHYTETPAPVLKDFLPGYHSYR